MSTEADADLGRALTLEELHRTFQVMECWNAPRLDGLPVELCTFFWPKMGEDILAVVSLAKGRLLLSCHRAVLTLLPKKSDLNGI